MILYFYSDNGHGWLAVKRNLVNRLEIADKISSCSYERGGTVYLEEDCDAPLLIEALKANNMEYELNVRNVNGRSPIRSYAPYHPR